MSTETLSPLHTEATRFLEWTLDRFGPTPEYSVLFTTQPQGKRNKLGHFVPVHEKDYDTGEKKLGTEQAWSTKEGDPVHEIVVCNEALFGTPLEVLAVVQHELVHLLNWEDDVRDTSKGGRHNADFKDRAEEMGLVVAKSQKVGWTTTGFTDEYAQKVRDEFVPDDAAYTLFGVTLQEKPKKPSNTVAWHVPQHPEAPTIRAGKAKDLSGLVQYMDEFYVKKEA